jgi:hypothetical protein
VTVYKDEHCSRDGIQRISESDVGPTLSGARNGGEKRSILLECCPSAAPLLLCDSCYAGRMIKDAIGLVARKTRVPLLGIAATRRDKKTVTMLECDHERDCPGRSRAVARKKPGF